VVLWRGAQLADGAVGTGLGIGAHLSTQRSGRGRRKTDA